MSEELKVDEYGEEIIETVEEDKTAENAGDKKTSKKTIKTFTQTDLNKVVKNRVAIEKKKSKKISDDNVIEVELLNSTITGYETIINDIIDAKKKEMPNEYLDLINKLSLSEQWEFLTKQDEKLSDKKVIPQTPIAKDDKDTKKSKTRRARVF